MALRGLVTRPWVLAHYGAARGLTQQPGNVWTAGRTAELREGERSAGQTALEGLTRESGGATCGH